MKIVGCIALLAFASMSVVAFVPGAAISRGIPRNTGSPVQVDWKGVGVSSMVGMYPPLVAYFEFGYSMPGVKEQRGLAET